MEKIMRQTHDTSKFDHAKPENRVLADSELNAVSGGAFPIVRAQMALTGWAALAEIRGESPDDR
jgi:hypothetical protein